MVNYLAGGELAEIELERFHIFDGMLAASSIFVTVGYSLRFSTINVRETMVARKHEDSSKPVDSRPQNQATKPKLFYGVVIGDDEIVVVRVVTQVVFRRVISGSQLTVYYAVEKRFHLTDGFSRYGSFVVCYSFYFNLNHSITTE